MLHWIILDLKKISPITSKRYEANDYYGGTNIKTGEITYGRLAFDDFATMKGTYYKESFTSYKVKNGISLETIPEDFRGLGFDTYMEEIHGYIYEFKNQGLYSGHNIPFKGVEFYQQQLRFFDISYPTYPQKWQWIYKIPRRW